MSKAACVQGSCFVLLAGQEERDPYWARPWPSAVGLAAELLARPELVAGRTVADLGAGLGLAGIAAAMAGEQLSSSNAFDVVR